MVTWISRQRVDSGQFIMCDSEAPLANMFQKNSASTPQSDLKLKRGDDLRPKKCNVAEKEEAASRGRFYFSRRSFNKRVLRAPRDP